MVYWIFGKYAIDDDGVNFNGMLIVFCEWNLPGRGRPLHRDDFTMTSDSVVQIACLITMMKKTDWIIHFGGSTSNEYEQDGDISLKRRKPGKMFNYFSLWMIKISDKN